MENKLEEFDVDENSGQVNALMREETVSVDGIETSLGDVVSDIKKAHSDLDEYKAGSLSLAQTLSEAADEADGKLLQSILLDMSDNAFLVYLRLQRGDQELLGERDGKYSGYLNE